MFSLEREREIGICKRREQQYSHLFRGEIPKLVKWLVYRR
jgi:hypothetical protein